MSVIRLDLAPTLIQAYDQLFKLKHDNIVEVYGPYLSK